MKKGSGPTKSASGRSRTNVAKAASISRLVLALKIWICSPIARGCRFHVSCNVVSALRTWPVDEHGNRERCGHQLTQEFQPLRRQLALRKLMPVRLPPGRARLATRPSLTGSSPTTKTMGIVVVAALAAKCRSGAADRGDHGDLSANQFGRQRRQPIDLTFGPAVFDRHVLALDIAGFLQALAKCAQTVRVRAAMRCRETRSPASPAAARAPPAATPPPRRRAA